MHINSNTVVSDNLPIYFIWFGSDIPQKYFGNLLRAAETNKSRDIILVYSEKHLPKDNRKNIDNIENIKINEIKERVELKRDSETKNLFKIDVYGMELDKQDEKIYDLLNRVFKARHSCNGKESLSYKYCIASDLIRLPLLNITGGVYFDIDTEVTGEVGNLKTKSELGFNVDKEENILCRFFARSTQEYYILGQIISKHIDKLFHMHNTRYVYSTCPASMIDEFIKQNNNKFKLSNFNCELPPTVKLKMEQGEGYNIDYNNPEDLKKLGLDKQSVISKLENLSLEQPGSSQEKGR